MPAPDCATYARIGPLPWSVGTLTAAQWQRLLSGVDMKRMKAYFHHQVFAKKCGFTGVVEVTEKICCILMQAWRIFRIGDWA